MAWETVSVTIENVEDKNPEIYVKRAEDKLSKGDIQSGIKEIDTAIAYCEPSKKHHYIYEKVKILFAAHKNADCVNLMKMHLKHFYDSFDSKKFIKVVELLIKSGNYSNNEIKKMLSEKNIPSVAVDNNRKNLKEYFLTRANQELSKINITDAIKAIDITLSYCDFNDMYYVLYDKVKMLYYARRFQECNQLIKEHLVIFYNQLNFFQFRNILDFLIKSEKYSEADVKSLLISKNIPWIFLNEMGSHELSYYYLKRKADEYVQSENYEFTLQYCALCIRVDPKQSPAFILRGYCYDELKKYNDAILCYDRAIRDFPEITDSYNARGLVKAKISNFENALSDFEEASRLDPEIGSYLNNKARVLMKLNRFTEAENCLINAIYLGKNKYEPDAEANYLLGNIYDKTGRYIRAFNRYKKASSIDTAYTIPENANRNKNLLYLKSLIVIFFMLLIAELIMSYKYSSDMSEGQIIEQTAKIVLEKTEVLADVASEETIKVLEKVSLVFHQFSQYFQ